jgi:thioredoxin-related protein
MMTVRASVCRAAFAGIFLTAAVALAVAAPVRSPRGAEMREAEEMPSKEVRWRTDHAAARKEAEKAIKPLVILFLRKASIHCERMEADTSKHAPLAAFLNTHAVPVKLDIADGQNLVIAGSLGVHLFPTLAIGNSDGKVLDQRIGYQEPAELLAALKKILNGPKAAK